MLPLDIGSLVDVGDPRVSPDGSTVAFVVTTIDVAANRYASAVWTAAADGSTPPARFTSGDDRDGLARWSPDGRRLAFVSHRRDSGSELYVVPFTGGEAEAVAKWPEEIEEVAWSPDGTRLAFTARVRDEARYGEERDADRPPRRITRLRYRSDNIGWTVDRPKHVFVVGANGTGGPPVQLTGGEVDDRGIAWSRDGTAIVFASGRTPTWDVDHTVDLHRVDAVAGGEPERLTDLGGQVLNPVWHGERDLIAFTTAEWCDVPRHAQVGVLDLDTGEHRILTAGLDRHCAPFVGHGAVWDGDDLLFVADDSGNVPLHRVSCKGGVPEVVAGGERWITGFDAAGGTIAYTVTDSTSLPELVVRVDDGAERCLTALGRSFHDRVEVSVPEGFVATSTGGAEVAAWLLRPKGFVAGVRYPVLLNIHGGPFSQYGNRLFDEFQVQAGAGYAVLYANPRGSSGRSEAWGRAIRGPRAAVDPGSGWGGVDADDVLAVLDAALARWDFLDPDRVGVLGGSYGGYLTTWLVGHTDRFVAACSERSLNNMLTFAHTSDIGASFPACYIGANHLEDPDEFVRQSPITYADRITTPLLVLHADGDLRCPVEQAEDLYVRLKLSGRDVELVRFPGSSHELSRTGSPRHRIERMEIILEWFNRHLQGDGGEPAAG